MTTLGDLLTETGAEEFLARIVSLFRLARFPVAAWQATALPRVLTAGLADALADLSALIRAIARGGHLSTAEEEWLDLQGTEVYDETRNAAVYTEGNVTLSDPLGQGPFTLSAGDVWVATAGRALRFTTLADVVVPLNGSVSVAVRGEFAGAAYNVAPETISEVLTPGGTGLAVANAADPDTGTWVTQQGVDTEKDNPYKNRCRRKWSTLGTGSNDSAYLYNATAASAEVTRAAVTADPDTGIVTLTIAGPAGPVSGTAYAAVAARIAAKRPICDRVNLINGVADPTIVGGTIYPRAGANVTVLLAAAQAAIEAEFRDRELEDPIYRARLIEIVMGIDGVRNFVLAAPAADTYPALPTVPVPLFALGAVS